jgi:hypothetical protein
MDTLPVARDCSRLERLSGCRYIQPGQRGIATQRPDIVDHGVLRAVGRKADAQILARHLAIGAQAGFKVGQLGRCQDAGEGRCAQAGVTARHIHLHHGGVELLAAQIRLDRKARLQAFDDFAVRVDAVFQPLHQGIDAVHRTLVRHGLHRALQHPRQHQAQQTTTA